MYIYISQAHKNEWKEEEVDLELRQSKSMPDKPLTVQCYRRLNYKKLHSEIIMSRNHQLTVSISSTNFEM